MKLQMQQHVYDGLLITFCGLDGCGKTTLIKRLSAYFQELGLPVMLTKQPTNAVRQSKIFRNYMDQEDHEGFEYRSLSLLAASDRVQHSNQIILPALKEGKIVLSDRYFYSCLANLQARGFEEDLWIYEIAKSIPKPDLAFFLDVDVETAIKRVRERPEERDSYIDVQLQYRLRKNYLRIAQESGGTIIQTSGDEDIAFEALMRQISKVLQHV